MSFLLSLALQTVMTSPTLAQPVPETAWNCRFAIPGGGSFTLGGRTPLFPAGMDMNGSLPAEIAGEGMVELTGRASVSPGHASDWFREFQISARRGTTTHRINLLLRREGTSIAHITRFTENDRQIPYEYFTVGLCAAQFAPQTLPAGQ
jgi:hypothetical protein